MGTFSRRLKPRFGSFVTRQLARMLDALRVPFNPYLAVGVPLRTAEVPGRTLEPPPATAVERAPSAVRPSGIDLDLPLMHRKFGPRPARPPLELFELRSGLADAKGLVLTSDGRVVNPVALGQEPFLSDWQHQVHRRRPAPVEGGVAALTQAHHGNLFHWYFEQIPKTLLFDAAFPEPPRFYLAQRHRFQRASVEMFDLDPERLVSTEHAPLIRAERLLAITHWSAFESIPAWVCDFLRARARLADAVPPAERIYVSRADASGRRVGNEGELLARLERFGFRRVVLSEWTLAEQAALFRGAAVVVGPHGAGLSHAVFCHPGAWLVELAAPRYLFGCWHDLAGKCGLDYSFVPAVGADLEVDHGWRHQREDFLVDVNAVVALLERGLG